MFFLVISTASILISRAPFQKSLDDSTRDSMKDLIIAALDVSVVRYTLIHTLRKHDFPHGNRKARGATIYLISDSPVGLQLAKTCSFVDPQVIRKHFILAV